MTAIRRKVRPTTRENVFCLMKSSPPREGSGEPCAGLYPRRGTKSAETGRLLPPPSNERAIAAVLYVPPLCALTVGLDRSRRTASCPQRQFRSLPYRRRFGTRRYPRTRNKMIPARVHQTRRGSRLPGSFLCRGRQDNFRCQGSHNWDRSGWPYCTSLFRRF